MCWRKKGGGEESCNFSERGHAADRPVDTLYGRSENLSLAEGRVNVTRAPHPGAEPTVASSSEGGLLCSQALHTTTQRWIHVIEVLYNRLHCYHQDVMLPV
ncbi:unnamed protein product [Pleuronectes platessa]|uniref:Uncharacterized protein n=1 Tax=Pleuronectes platessa TaxID=8262 RepID=A0A9N7Z090_PLEPL|nr:unnamed protein product [Pleuronectes platessa]